MLNAQLQAALSVADYGRRANDAGARWLARELRRSAERLLPRFDTGSWSRYSLAGQDSTLEYHDYVTSLLWKLSRRTGRPVFRAYAAGRASIVELGRGDSAGERAVAAALDPAWVVTLIATDSAGNATWVPLEGTGEAPRLGRTVATLAVRRAA